MKCPVLKYVAGPHASFYYPANIKRVIRNVGGGVLTMAKQNMAIFILPGTIHQLIKRLLLEYSGSQVRFTCNFRKPASSPGVGI